jgi:HlyD family secretion protein
MNTKLAITTTALVVTGLTLGAYYRKGSAAAPAFTTARVERGSVVDAVGATGSLEAVTTVQVGTQVSGTVEALYADFNSIVRRGQVIARLETSLFQTHVEQEQANLVRAEADRERLLVSLSDADTKLRRAIELSERQLIPAVDLEAAEVARRSAEAQLRSAEAQVTQAAAALNQVRVNLQKTVIASPIDGIVIARNVDIGQTVAASLQAPTLFVIAADLSKMRVNASIDEADVGRVRPGQPVTFRVDAFPEEEFEGRVSQVRLSPVVQQNVVTYAAVIDVPNPELKLKPGMTATVSIEVARRDGVLRVSESALRYQPTAEIFAALGQATPEGNSSAARKSGSTDRGGPVWRYDGGRLASLAVRPGLSDGRFIEVTGEGLEEGIELVTAVNLGEALAARPVTGNAVTAGNPLLGPQRRPGPAGGAAR